MSTATKQAFTAINQAAGILGQHNDGFETDAADAMSMLVQFVRDQHWNSLNEDDRDTWATCLDIIEKVQSNLV